ncbi:MAG TPA: M12 family metallopeptidase, partial [Chitinophagaceae bacterium]|nr:M12 family metallopeptidase [Chitinophagaceae bacterium]
ATIFLVTACQKSQREVASFKQGNSVEQELYMPNVQGISREFTLTLPLSSRPQKVTTEIKDNLVIMDGDIILGNVVEFEGSNAVAIDGASYRWTNSVIPYVISAGHPKKTDIEWAIQHVSSTTNICLVPRTNEANYIQFVNGSGCASYVGKQGGRQDITIGSCSRGSIAHEILHSAGLFHEQSREDRDNYVTINWANIQDGKSHNFDKHVTDATDIGTYDYGSIMHYPKDAFSKNTSNTIDIKIPPGTATTVIGQRTGLSTKDIQAVNSLYSPGPCKEDCLPINPLNVTVKQSGNIWLVVDGSHSAFSAPNKAEADQIVKIIKFYGINKSCYVGRPNPSFQYLLKGTTSPVGSMPGEDVIGFNPATLSIVPDGSQYLMTDGFSRMFMFPNKPEADMALTVIRKYGFTKQGYVGRPGASLQYMRK